MSQKANRGGRRAGGGSTVSPDDILSTTSLVSERERKQIEVDQTLTVFRDVYNEYNYVINDIELATLKPKSSALAYYDGSNVAVNQSFFNAAKMERAYAACVKDGFHPSNGNKTALQAVVAHELGHALTDAVADKMGLTGMRKIYDAANRIVKEARPSTGHRGVVQMERKISGYATTDNAEAVAEAYSDVYCNGNKAAKESRAIVNVLNSYLKRR